MPHLPAPFLNSTGSHLASSLSPSGAAASSLPRAVAKPVQRELDWLQGRSEIVQAQDAARAELTAQAMHHVGALTMTGQTLAQAAPASAAHLEVLLASYTTSAAQAIARFQ